MWLCERFGEMTTPLGHSNADDYVTIDKATNLMGHAFSTFSHWDLIRVKFALNKMK